jgi:hypothetical protein
MRPYLTGTTTRPAIRGNPRVASVPHLKGRRRRAHKYEEAAPTNRISPNSLPALPETITHLTPVLA